jgi:hypothetical protein
MISNFLFLAQLHMLNIPTAILLPHSKARTKLHGRRHEIKYVLHGQTLEIPPAARNPACQTPSNRQTAHRSLSPKTGRRHPRFIHSCLFKQTMGGNRTGARIWWDQKCHVGPFCAEKCLSKISPSLRIVSRKSKAGFSARYGAHSLPSPGEKNGTQNESRGNATESPFRVSET